MTDNAATLAAPADADLIACEQEPIHIPGGVQPHGVLFVVTASEHLVRQVSANTQGILGRAPDEIIGKRLGDIFDSAVATALTDQSLGQAPLYLCTTKLPTPGGVRAFNIIAHAVDELTILELEPAASDQQLTFRYLHNVVQRFVERLNNAASEAELSQMVATEVRRITGFDRVLIYRFDHDWNGQVVAEDRDDALAAYLDLRFPASDIPRQARELYRRNRLRLIVDARQDPAPLVPARRLDTDGPLDLTFASLRAVSPVHREYLGNMGVVTSMSVSVLVDGELWGLISCHHPAVRLVPFDIRTACDLIGQLFALEIAATEHRKQYEQRIVLKGYEATLLAYMAREAHFINALTQHTDELLALTGADGAAVLYEDHCALLGVTPPEAEVRALAAWLAEQGQEIFTTDIASTVVPNGEALRATASGVLAIAISKLYGSYVIWFRPEVIAEVRWGGDPTKPVEVHGNGRHRLSPRKSFETWRETVRGRSRPWQAAHREAAIGLRNAIIGIVLRKAEELAALSAELTRANRELEAFSYSVSHDLRAPFRHIVGYSELLRDHLPENMDDRTIRYLDTIVESAHFAGTLVDNLLAFSQIGRTELHPTAIALDELVQLVRRDFDVDLRGRRVHWEIGALPTVVGDPILLRLALQNLLGNAIKYTRPRDHAQIAVTGTVDGEDAVISIRDNGVGFDMRYAHKLFGVFQRLHRAEDFEGTGIGLASVRRIAERHGGRVWADGIPDGGATFHLALPLHPPQTPATSDAETDSTR